MSEPGVRKVRGSDWTGILEMLKPKPQVVLTGDEDGMTCTIDDAGLTEIKDRARALLSFGIAKGFGGFPIDKGQLRNDLVDTFLSEDNICHVFKTESGATEKNHDSLRNKYKSDKLEPKNAFARGMIAKRIELEDECPANFDWKGSPNFNDVDSCEDILKEIEIGMPAVLYGAKISRSQVEEVLNPLSASVYYSRYSNSGPVECSSDHAKPGDIVAYQSFDVSSFYVLDFIIKITNGDGWSAWQLLKSCTTASGKKLKYDDLKFDNGTRVYVPVEVTVNGGAQSYTLIMSGIAAASNESLSGIIPDDTAYYRYIGGEFAKLLKLKAREKGWKVE